MSTVNHTTATPEIPAGYKAFGKFSPVYDEAKAQLFEHMPVDRARQAINVLNAFAEYASPIGTCFPSVRRIMEKTHYSETTVKRALIALGELDYIRVHKEFSTARQKELITYQLSPYVFWVVPDHIETAIKTWNITTLTCNEIIHAYPTPEPKTEPSFNNQQNYPNPEPTSSPTASSNPMPQADGSKQNSQRNAPKQKTKKNNTDKPKSGQRNAPNSNSDEISDIENQREAQPQNPPQFRAAPPLSACKEPLQGYAETLAETLQGLGTRITQARQLVRTYDCENVETALKWLDEARKNGDVENPYGLLKWWLSNNAILPNDQPRRKSKFGQYSDLFES